MDLTAQRKQIDRKVARVEKAVRAAIDTLEGDPDYESYLQRFDDLVRPAGLTAAISACVSAAGERGVTPVEVRETVRSMLLGHANPMASVYTILGRLVKTGDFEKSTQGGQTVYRSVDRQRQNNSEFQAYIAGVANTIKK